MEKPEPCPVCDNTPPYYLGKISGVKRLLILKVDELAKENAALKAELYQLKKGKLK